ncbi:MAG: hypothetical protein QGH94_03145 [Phycisphaerae bacterium]|jgi:hypothetical protein|nr:hypothetical protein [Phycisphaerae bacterium]MDP7286971.1 hypothetical protein [Phycisphaerae bacterium]
MADSDTHTIVAVHITDRIKEAVDIQKVLTQYGDIVKTRLGLHEVDAGGLSGLLLLDVIPPADRIEQFENDLLKIEGVEVKTISFEH